MIHWLIAFIITLASIYYQRTTGPTYPLKGAITLEDQIIRYRLERAHSTASDQPVIIRTPDSMMTGEVLWRRFPTNDAWQTITMNRHGDTLFAALPRQPAAGKLEYAVVLTKGKTQVRLPEKGAVITRFRGDVPGYFLVPHIVLMFVAMLLSIRTGLEAVRKEGHPRAYVWTTVITLFLGGMIFGGLVQKYAFGAFWAGFPLGMDLTDNKTLIALLGWIAATIAVEKNRYRKFWVLTAALLMLAVYAIPHSLFGSELKY
ncbi:MAG: hypothetical protein ONB44_02810 [candidate division KSB1 bacterium]|nr:hypothetical protein [candidate division KSB1 bacterium]MDZ7301056.1 hypothetical protein [candidate division KSB1 bacterium]MDZ7312120.1 hypothetical protein [candidate division KSB1 bacterium]